MGDNYAVTMYDVDGKQQGRKEKALPNDRDTLLVKGQGGLKDLAVIRTGEFGKGGTKGSVVEFSYGPKQGFIVNPFTDFYWNTESQGCDANYAKSDPDVMQPGGYCKVPDIEDIENGPQQTITCFFPCNAS